MADDVIHAERTFRITEEPSGSKDTVFYVRELPYYPGRSIQMTALSRDAAEWLISRLP